MTKSDDIQAQVQEENKRFYDDESISGHAPSPESDDDVSEALEEVIGNAPTQKLNIAKEIDSDENAATEKPIDDYQAETVADSPSDDGEEGRLAGVAESLISSTQDPFELLTDADFKKKG